MRAINYATEKKTENKLGQVLPDKKVFLALKNSQKQFTRTLHNPHQPITQKP